MIPTFFRDTLPKRLVEALIKWEQSRVQKRFRMIEEKHRERGTWEISTAVLLELLCEFRKSDFAYYTVDIARQVNVNTGFRNAEDVARRLRRICQLIKEDEIISDKIIASTKTPWPRTLDEFLTTDRTESVAIGEFIEEIRDSIISLHHLLLDRSSDSRVPLRYYRRVTKGILGDVYIILEGLLTAALMR